MRSKERAESETFITVLFDAISDEACRSSFCSEPQHPFRRASRLGKSARRAPDDYQGEKSRRLARPAQCPRTRFHLIVDPHANTAQTQPTPDLWVDL